MLNPASRPSGVLAISWIAAALLVAVAAWLAVTSFESEASAQARTRACTDAAAALRGRGVEANPLALCSYQPEVSGGTLALAALALVAGIGFVLAGAALNRVNRR